MADEPRQKVDLLTQGVRLGRASKIGQSAANPLGTVRAAADMAATPYLDKQAQKFAKKQQAKVQRDPAKKKMTGIGFWLVVGIALMKDGLDIILNLSVFLIFLVIPLSFLFLFMTFMYLYLEGVKMDNRKLATIIISFIVDMLPLLSIIPAFTFSLFIIRFLENAKGSGFLGKIAKRTPVGRALSTRIKALR